MTTYPDLPVPLHGDEAVGGEEVKCHHCRLVPNVPDIPQQPKPCGVPGVAQAGHHVDAAGQAAPGDAVKGDKAGGRGQGAAPRACDAGAGAVAEAAGVAKGTSEGAALEAPGPPAGAGLGAVGGQDGLGNLFSMDKMWKAGKSGIKWPKNGDDDAVRCHGRGKGGPCPP